MEYLCACESSHCIAFVVLLESGIAGIDTWHELYKFNIEILGDEEKS